MGKGIIITEQGQGAPFRKLPSAEGEMIGAFEPNTEIELTSYDNGWYAVNYEGEDGFVSGKFVQALDGIEGLDGKMVKAAKKVANAVKKVTGKSTKKTVKAAPAKTVVKSVIEPTKVLPTSAAAVKAATKSNGVSKITTAAKSAVEKVKNNAKMIRSVPPQQSLTKQEAAKIYEANKIVSVERTPKGLSITLEGTDGFDGFDGMDDEEMVNGVMGAILANTKKAIKKAVENNKPNVVKVTSKGVYEANKVINIQRTNNGFRVTLQGINGFDGIDGLDDEETLNGLLKNIGNAIKNVGSKVVNGGKKVLQKVTGGAKTVTEAAEAVNQATEAVQNASQNTAAAVSTASAAAPSATNANSNNIQNSNAMENQEQTSSNQDKTKKILKYVGIGAGVLGLGFLGYKLLKSKKQTAAAPAASSSASLSGVRRNSKKKRKSSAKKIELS